MDNKLFLKAREQVLGAGTEPNGIGTLGEKTLHAVLKQYLEPERQYQEVPVGGFVADIKRGRRIIEIQTRSFDRLLKKLPELLQEHDVTVVYPLPHRKTLSWIDPETGETTKARRSPKTGTPADAFRELYKLRPLFPHSGLTIHIMMIDLEEYRYLNGWSYDKKRGSSRCDRLPSQIAAEYMLCIPQDFAKLLPPLPKPFLVKDLMKAARISQRAASCGVALLRALGVIRQCGTQGRAYCYELAEEEENHG